MSDRNDNINGNYNKKIIRAQAVAKRWLAVRNYTKLRKRNNRRNHVAKELLSTESTYVQSLETLQNVYFKPMTDLLQSGTITQLLNSIPTEEEIRAITGNFELILGVNRKFLSELDARMKTGWTAHTRLADILLQFVPFFKMYTDYVSNYNNAITTLDNLRAKYPLVDQIYLEGQTKTAADGRLCLTMESYLIMPVQRMPRYKLLLEELVCFTWEEHPDFQALCKALKLVHDVNTHIDRSVAMQDSRFQVFTIQNKLAGECGELVQPHRVWLAEAEMQLATMNGSEALWICLFNDIVILAVRVLLSYKFTAKLSLEKTIVVPLPDSKHYSNVFQLIHEDDCHTIVASDSDQKSKWIQQLNSAIEQLLLAQPQLQAVRDAAERKRSLTVTDPSVGMDTDRKIAVSLVRQSEYQSQQRDLVASMTITERRQLFEMGLMKQRPEQQKGNQLAREIKLITKGLAAQKRLEWESFHHSRAFSSVPTLSPQQSAIASANSSNTLSPSTLSARNASPSVSARGRAPSNILQLPAQKSSLPLAAIDPAAAARIGTATASPKRDSRAEIVVITPGTVLQKKAAFQPTPMAASAPVVKSASPSARDLERMPLLSRTAGDLNGDEPSAETAKTSDRSCCDCTIL